MNSRSAWPNEARAGVNTGSVPHRDRGTDGSFHCGWPGLVSWHAAVAMNSTAAARSSAALLLACTTETTNEVDEVPGVRLGDLALEALHIVFRRRAVLHDPEDFAFARAARPFGVGQVRRLHVLRRHRAVTGAGVAVAKAAVLREEDFSGVDRRGRRRERRLHFLGLGRNRGWTSGCRRLGEHANRHDDGP